MMQQISYNPGIVGFVKGHRHPSGSALIMSVFEEDDWDVICVFWTKRVHPHAKPVHAHIFVAVDGKSMRAAERTYEILLAQEPPDAAACDYQRERVYAWENNFIYPGRRKLTWTGCERFAQRVWQSVGSGSLQLTKDRRFVDAISLEGLIHLPERDRCGGIGFFWRKPVILHEIAHELNRGNQHGPRFVSTYIDLCERFLGCDRGFLKETATECGIRLR